MIDKGTTNSKRVAKVHARHGCKFVDVLALHPDTLCIVMANRIEKPVLLRKKPWWHTRVEDECSESEKISESHRPSGNSESVMGGCKMIVPRDKSAFIS